MSNLEHYFENLLFDGRDIPGDWNKNALSEEQQKAVEECADYIVYGLFGDRGIFLRWLNEWSEPEEEPHNCTKSCCNCTHYDGVHGCIGHAPCKYWDIGGVMWNDYCSRFIAFAEHKERA